MADAYQALAKKDKIINALTAALEHAFSTLEDFQYLTSDEIDDAVEAAEQACEEIIHICVTADVPKEHIPGYYA